MMLLLDTKRLPGGWLQHVITCTSVFWSLHPVARQRVKVLGIHRHLLSHKPLWLHLAFFWIASSIRSLGAGGHVVRHAAIFPHQALLKVRNRSHLRAHLPWAPGYKEFLQRYALVLGIPSIGGAPRMSVDLSCLGWWIYDVESSNQHCWPNV